MKRLRGFVNSPLVRYVVSVCIPIAALLLHQVLLKLVGGNLPTYIFFYPAVIIAALFAGFRAGLLATATAALLADYWIIPPKGFAIESLSDAIGLAIFLFNGVLISAIAELYGRARTKAANYATELALRDERKRVEEVLYRNEERYRTIVEQMEDAYFETDLSGNFTFANEAECRNIGYTREELIGMDSSKYADEKTANALRRLFVEVYKTGVPVKAYDLELIKKDGTKSYDEISVSLIRNSQGKAIGFRGISRDVTERKQTDEKIKQMAYHDSLTSLPNRKLFSDRLSIALAQAQRNQKKVGIAMLDLDNFKGVNDTLGHNVGDLLLKAVAERLSEMLRKSDTVARFGGDEFLLITHELKGIDDAIRIAQKIVDSFRKPFLIDSHQLIVTTSIGIAVYPHNGTNEDILLKNADTAMFQAKQTGRDRYQFYKNA